MDRMSTLYDIRFVPISFTEYTQVTNCTFPDVALFPFKKSVWVSSEKTECTHTHTSQHNTQHKYRHINTCYKHKHTLDTHVTNT